MSFQLRILVFVLLLAALFFGFLHLFFDADPYNFERLHVFLFNLCCGGTVILYFTGGHRTLTPIILLFLVLSICYAILAFFMIYIPAIIIALVLAAIVEWHRITRFALFPWGFFQKTELVSHKFHQAALLCLSIGLVFSAAVILNNEYLHLISLPKLRLDVFFLGFSFPVSLITLSLIFSFLDKSPETLTRLLTEGIFWAINLGVIVFFVFILAEWLPSQVAATIILFIAVVLTLYLYGRFGENLQQKNFLTSGVCFLLVSAITGIAYIITEFSPVYNPDQYHWLIKLHAFASLYGWNLCGLTVICRYHDFPIKLHSFRIVLLHWIVALVLAPLGVYFPLPAILALAGYALLLYVILFSSGGRSK
jgi:hypothetical protein